MGELVQTPGPKDFAEILAGAILLSSLQNVNLVHLPCFPHTRPASLESLCAVYQFIMRHVTLFLPFCRRILRVQPENSVVGILINRHPR